MEGAALKASVNYRALSLHTSDPCPADTQSEETPGVAMHRGSCFWKSEARMVPGAAGKGSEDHTALGRAATRATADSKHRL
jgi:hypothetical protein